MPNDTRHDKWLGVGFLAGTAIAVGSVGFWTGAVFVAKYLPEKAPFAVGMLAGALPVGAIDRGSRLGATHKATGSDFGGEVFGWNRIYPLWVSLLPGGAIWGTAGLARGEAAALAPEIQTGCDSVVTVVQHSARASMPYPASADQYDSSDRH